MTINTEYYLMCNNCSRLLYDYNGVWAFESKEELIRLAEYQSWEIGRIVPDGSKWDLCPNCRKRGLR